MKMFKYNLNYYQVPEVVRLPKNARVVDFGIQGKSFKIWALVEPKNTEEERVFVLAMTGQEIPWTIKNTFGTRIIKVNGLVIHLLELDGVEKGTGSLLANDPLEDERLLPPPTEQKDL